MGFINQHVKCASNSVRNVKVHSGMLLLCPQFLWHLGYRIVGNMEREKEKYGDGDGWV